MMSKKRNPRPVRRDVEFWDYGKHELNGYQQSGDIHGKFFGTWLRRHDGMNIIISFGDETKRYWLQIGNCFYGNYTTLELAATEADRLERDAEYIKIAQARIGHVTRPHSE
jgi:hypothetical protein